MTKIPEVILKKIQEAKEKQLKKLDLSQYGLTEIPDEVFILKQLEILTLEINSLPAIPESISRLQNLTYLNLNRNQLTSLPESISRLQNLTTLNLWNNQITTIPESITRLQNLTIFDLEHNPIETPPLEIVNKGIEAIKSYFRQLEAEGKDYLYEAKLLIIGEAGAGKTTLAKKIENPDYQLQKNEKSTEGIDVIQYTFKMDNNKVFRVNIWDFGGQEIYHATHQFFLTKRSLYALVADTRKEDTDFYYWLNVVELLSDSSPLLIIKNEKQDRQKEIDERALRGQFPNLEETLATNLANNRGLSEVLNKIQHYISNLPHVGTPLPKTWKKVREVLEKDTRNYISLNDIVINNRGRFNKADLANIWQEEKYANMQDELLQLMIKFKLCYQIPSSQDTYSAPQLLTLNQPDYPWDKSYNFILRYTYEFMPKGIITQFIVAMNPYIYEQKYVWRSGVILNKNVTKAEVIENYDKREIKIRVAVQVMTKEI
ncbi:MAG: COR domain-containing protein [Microcystaceae cyanobacterium]